MNLEQRQLLRKRIEYILVHWKLGVHLIFRTKRFGVNDRWWSQFDSMFGWSLQSRIWGILTLLPLFHNLQQMEWRIRNCHFLTDGEYELLFWRKKTDTPLTYKLPNYE